MPELPVECCGNCKFSAPHKQDLKQRRCRNEPPKVFMLPVQTGPQPGQVGVQFFSEYPPNQADEWCGRWQRNPSKL